MPATDPSANLDRIDFGAFVLDGPRGCLWRHGRVVPLRRKAWEVLYRLASQRGEVLASAELLDAVWGRIAISPQVLTNTIHELRVALDDTGAEPRFIRTIRGRGYVFLAETRTSHAGDARAGIVVGRDPELRRLARLWELTVTGTSRVCFVSGEPGIGKTTLVDTFLTRVADESPAGSLCIGRGCCAEQHGSDEAYLPILAAIEEVLDAPAPHGGKDELRRCAPAWLAQIPWRLDDAERAALEVSLAWNTPPRMLQQGLAFFRAVAVRAPLILVLEDMHWSDLATLDLLAALARRPIPAPLLVLATYRRVDATARAHAIVPLVHDLLRDGGGEEIALGPLDRSAAGAYVAARFGSAELAFTLADRLAEHSAGNPLFMRALVDELVARNAVLRTTDGWRLGDDVEAALGQLPQSLRAFITVELDGLSAPARDVVEAGSVAGLEFTATELAAAVAREALQVERTCEALARRGRLLRITDDADSGRGRAHETLRVRPWRLPAFDVRAARSTDPADLAPPHRRRARDRRCER